MQDQRGRPLWGSFEGRHALSQPRCWPSPSWVFPSLGTKPVGDRVVWIGAQLSIEDCSISSSQFQWISSTLCATRRPSACQPQLHKTELSGHPVASYRLLLVWSQRNMFLALACGAFDLLASVLFHVGEACVPQEHISYVMTAAVELIYVSFPIYAHMLPISHHRPHTTLPLSSSVVPHVLVTIFITATLVQTGRPTEGSLPMVFHNLGWTAFSRQNFSPNDVSCTRWNFCFSGRVGSFWCWIQTGGVSKGR